ncbi:MAG: ABC transporter permease [Bacteroidales bacterium]|nr:ABC transporter permease [Bacteroidales bacterium]MBR6175274.1 ABC transporter permease [Bacteroidales bacterium]
MRIIQKSKTEMVSAILNIVGLAAAFAALYIILVQVRHDLTYNKALKDSDRIYVLTTQESRSSGYSSYMCRPIGEYVVNASPDIEAGGCGRVAGYPTMIYVGDDQSPVKISISSLNKGAREVFGIELVAGNWDDLTGVNCAISESAAKRLGIQVGDVVKYYGGAWQETTIVAIYKDMPKHSDLSSFEMFTDFPDVLLDEWKEFSFNYFVKLREGADPEAITEAAKPVCKRFFSEMKGGNEVTDDDVKFGIRPVLLTEMYFADPNKNFTVGKMGNRTTTITMLVIAIFVVLIAFINYINFFFAMVPLRLRGFNTRKILGSSRFQLVVSSVGESLLMVAVALGLALTVVIFFKQSTLASLIETSLDLGQNYGIVALTIGLALFISVVASLYPALFVTSFNPAVALKGTFGTTQKGKAFRIALIGLQFTVSIVLIICVIFVHKQRNFMMNHEMGFNKECLLQSQVSGYLATNREAVESKLKADAAVKDIAWGSGPFVSDARMSWGRTLRGEDVSYQVYPVSWNFLQFMGIDIVEGRDFKEADEQGHGIYIFNETARDKYNITLEDQIGGHDDQIVEIAGFCKDFNFASLRQSIEPFAFYVYGKEPWKSCDRIFIRTAAGIDVPALMDRIVKILNDLDPNLGKGMSYEVKPFEQAIENQYKKETNLSTLVTLFTILAIVISLMGVFGLVMFETEHRRKEIGIRRVHGATVKLILAMFNSRFVKIALVCFVIAVPLSVVIMQRYLEGFAYRIRLFGWVFAVALLAVLAVTVAVVTLRSLRAATMNPVKSLRTE